MNISDASSRSPSRAQAGRISADALRLSEGELSDIRMKIYHSTGDGYYVFRNFVPPDIVKHMRELWTGIDPAVTHQLFLGKEYIYAGCPDYYVRYPDGSTIFHNFLFAEPLDEVTREVSLCVHMLRNRLSGRNAFDDMFGPRGAVSYRVTINKNFETWIAPHRDFLDFERRLEKGQYDPSRLQATLFLSEKGVDYEGVAFSLERNDGSTAVFGDDVVINPGDLVIWKYTNLHGVSQISTPPGKVGLVRILYTIEDLHPHRHLPVQAVAPQELTMPYWNLLQTVASRGVKGVMRRIRTVFGA